MAKEEVVNIWRGAVDTQVVLVAIGVDVEVLGEGKDKEMTWYLLVTTVIKQAT